jgi:hypothetical protein
VAEEIARRLAIPPSTTRRLLARVKRELATAAATGEYRHERPAELDHVPVERADRPVPPEYNRPGKQALVVIAREGDQ